MAPPSSRQISQKRLTDPPHPRYGSHSVAVRRPSGMRTATGRQEVTMARQHGAAVADEAAELRPRTPIRRFDVFAEYKRLEAERRGAAPEEAQGYGIWVAKVVAGRRYGRSHAAPTPGHHAA